MDKNTRDGDKMDERDDINKYRENKLRKKSLIRLIVFAVITAALVIVVINWRSILAPLKNIGLKSSGGGFPVNLTRSANYAIGKLGENFYLLTDTYLYTYNDDGAELSNKQHGLQKPVCSSNDKRALVYDRSGKDIKVYSKSSEVFSKSFEDSIVFAEMGTDERSAVVTTASRYSNYLYVLNLEGKQIFRWASPDEMIMQVCFDDGDKSIYVSVVGEKNGTLNSSVLRFEINEKTTSETWRAPIGGSVSYSLQKCSDGVYAVTSEGAYLINEKTGELKASNVYSKEIVGIAETDGLRVTLFHDPVSNGIVATAYSEELEPFAAAALESSAAFDVHKGKFYSLCGNRLTVYDAALEEIAGYDLDDEYSDMIIIGKNAYLLGYNKVQRQSLKD